MPVGLTDRGEIAIGKRADLIRVHVAGSVPRGPQRLARRKPRRMSETAAIAQDAGRPDRPRAARARGRSRAAPARTRCCASRGRRASTIHDIVFSRRIVDARSSADEDNIAVTSDEFRRAARARRFRRCTGMRTGIPTPCRLEINDDIRAGRTVVANVSRTVIAALRRTYANVVVVAITAPPDVLRQRLAARARTERRQHRRASHRSCRRRFGACAMSPSSTRAARSITGRQLAARNPERKLARNSRHSKGERNGGD